MRNFYLPLVLIIVVMLAGCASFSSFQTAQVLDPDEDEFQIGIGLAVTSFELEEDAVETDYEEMSYYKTELLIRSGVTESFDFGAKFWTVGLAVDGKYQFVDGEKIDMAVDLGFSYSGIEVDDEGVRYFGFHPALLMTYNFSEKFSVTLSPRAVILNVSHDEEGDDTQTFLGGTLTLSLGGKKVRILPEIGYYKAEDRLGQEVEVIHGGIGIKF
jgi:hypothetical protein